MPNQNSTRSKPRKRMMLDDSIEEEDEKNWPSFVHFVPFDIVLIRMPVSGSFITINDKFIWNYHVTKFGLLNKILLSK